MESTIVTMAGSPSGIAETASETAVIKISSTAMPVEQSHDEDDRAGDQRHDAQILAQLRQLLLQRRLRLVLAFKQAGDAAHLGLHARAR